IIHDMAFTIIASKNTNKSLDLTSKEEVSKFFKKNLPYLSSSELNNINLEFTPINNSDEYKLTVYSIIDNDNKILGSPYVFRFGYENIAPKFNPLEMCYSSYEDECVIAIGAENTEFEIPIYQYVTENNLI